MNSGPCRADLSSLQTALRIHISTPAPTNNFCSSPELAVHHLLSLVSVQSDPGPLWQLETQLGTGSWLCTVDQMHAAW